MIKILIKAHYEAWVKAQHQEAAFDAFITAMHNDNYPAILRSPYQDALEKLIKNEDPNLFDWYMWYLYEPNQFYIKNKEYHAKGMPLNDFLELICDE